MTIPRSFLQSYRDFYTHFFIVVKDKGCSPQGLEFTTTQQGKNSWLIELEEPIHLSRWPIMPYTSVDISVHAAFHCGQRQGVFVHTKSSVYLTYFRRHERRKTAEPMENVRFDYHPDVDDAAHPLLHAHIFANEPPNSIPQPLEKNCTIDWEPLEQRLNSFRVPVPNMTLPSVLCCLVASHLGANEIKKLLELTKKIRGSFSDLAIIDTQKDLFYTNSLAGAQWFERS